MNRRFTGAGRSCRPLLVTLLWSSQLLAAHERCEVQGNLAGGDAYLGDARRPR